MHVPRVSRDSFFFTFAQIKITMKTFVYKKIMRRVIPFILIVFLIACNNQQENKDNTNTESQNIQEAVVSETENIVDVEANAEQEVPDPNKAGEAMELEPERMPVAENTEAVMGQNKPQDRETANLFNSGTTAYENGDFESGVGFFEQIVANKPDSRQAYYNLGLGYYELQKYTDAIQAFSKAIEIKPDDAQSINYRGRVYYTIGNFTNCLEDYETVVKLTPNDAVAYYNRGIAKGQMKDYLGSIKDFDKAIELNPAYAEAYFNRGLANYFQGRMHEACFDWEKAHNLGHYESEKAIRAYCGKAE